MANRPVRTFLGAAILLALAVGMTNYINLQYPMSRVSKADSRNEGIEALVHYQYYVNPNVLVYDLRAVSEDSSPIDVTRVLLQYAAQQKDRSFSVIELSHRGDLKFVLHGDYFQKLGKEYGEQNPAYTIRTLPQNLYKLDGTPAFGTWTGGILGVLGRQMEDFGAWHRDWYINELTTGRSAY